MGSLEQAPKVHRQIQSGQLCRQDMDCGGETGLWSLKPLQNMKELPLCLIFSRPRKSAFQSVVEPYILLRHLQYNQTSFQKYPDVQ